MPQQVNKASLYIGFFKHVAFWSKLKPDIRTYLHPYLSKLYKYIDKYTHLNIKYYYQGVQKGRTHNCLNTIIIHLRQKQPNMDLTIYVDNFETKNKWCEFPVKCP